MAWNSALSRVLAGWHAYCKTFIRYVFFPGITEDRKMKMFLAVLLSVVASDGPALADSSDLAEASGHRVPVAIVDVAKVFKEARDFNQKVQSIKLQIADFDRDIKAKGFSPDLNAEIKEKKAVFLSD